MLKKGRVKVVIKKIDRFKIAMKVFKSIFVSGLVIFEELKSFFKTSKAFFKISKTLKQSYV